MALKTENGWYQVGADQCEWTQVPGTNVNLQIQKGWPLAILRAFAADWNAYLEPLRDADSACWTPTNSVATSNHLSATAADCNWNSHPFRVKDAGFTPQMIATMRDMLKFYEDTVWWGNDWQNPRDSMHVQLGGNTFNNPHTQDFINRKIRADGFSTFRRTGTAPPTNTAVDVLARAAGIAPTKAQEILPGVVNGLRDSQATNVNRVAMWLAQIGHESAGFNATEEYQDGDESTDRWKYKGRTWIQITWKSNYAGLSAWAFGKGIVPTPTYFVDNPRKLAEIQYAGLGPAWYWTVARPQINALCDAADLIGVTKAINGGLNGIDDRRKRWTRAYDMGDQLLTLTTATPTTGDDMALVPQDQWDRVYRELTQPLPSRSPLRHLGEGVVDTVAGFVLNADGSTHVEVVKMLAGLGQPAALTLLREIAGADPARFPDRQEDAKLAQAILSEVTAPATRVSAPAPTHLGGELADAVAENAKLRDEISRLNVEIFNLLQTVSQANKTAAEELATLPALAETGSKTSGQLVGGVVDSMEEYIEAALTMNPKQRDALTRALNAIELSQTNGAKK